MLVTNVSGQLYFKYKISSAMLFFKKTIIISACLMILLKKLMPYSHKPNVVSVIFLAANPMQKLFQREKLILINALQAVNIEL